MTDVLDWTPIPKDQRHNPRELVKWRAKLVKGKHRRVEIRKSVLGQEPDITRPGGIRYWAAQILLVVDGQSVKLSANGPMRWSPEEWAELARAVSEAQVALDTPPMLL